MMYHIVGDGYWIFEQTLPNIPQTKKKMGNEMSLAISAEEWQLLRHVKETKEVSDDLGYQKLIRSRFVFEYRDKGELWFDVNPILAESEKLQ